MAVYLCMTFISALFAYYSRKYYKPSFARKRISFSLKIRKRVMFAYLTVIPSILVAGLRVNVGTDYTTYLKTNMYIGSVFSGTPISMEPIYRLLVEIGHHFNSTQLVYFLTAAVFSVFMFLFIFEQSDNWTLSVILFLITGTFTQSLNIMRQMVAIAIVLYALKYLINRNLKAYVFWIIVAGCFHSMGLVFILLYPLGRTRLLKINQRRDMKKIIFIIATLVLINQTTEYIYHLFYVLLSRIGSAYAIYFGSSRDTGVSTLLVFVEICILAISLVCSLYITDTKRIEFINLTLLFNLLTCISLALRLPNASRIAYLFIPIQIAGLPDLFCATDSKGLRRLSIAAVLLIYGFFWYRYFYVINISETFPYMSVFNQ